MALLIPRRGPSEVAPSTSPNVRNSPSLDFGGGRAAAQAYGQARGLADDSSEIILREEMKAQEAEFNQLSILADKAEMTRKEALAKVQGRAALQASQDALKDFDFDAKGIESQATSPAVAERLAARMQRNRLGLEATGQHHARQEMEKYEAQEFAGLRESTVNRGATAYADPLQVAMAEDELIQLHKRNGALTGKAPALVAQEMAEDRSALHSGVVMQFMKSGQDVSAKRYFESNNDFMTARDQIRLGPQVDRVSVMGEAQRRRNEIMLNSKSPEEARERAKQWENPEGQNILLNMVEEEWRHKMYQEDQREKADVSNALSSIEKYYDKAKAAHSQSQIMSVKPVTAEELVSPPDWARLPAKNKIILEKYVNDIRKAEGIKTSEDAFTEVRAMTRQQLSAMSEVDFTSKYMPRMNRTDYKQAREIFDAANKDGPAFDSLYDKSTIIWNATKGANLGGSAEEDTLSSINQMRKGSYVDERSKDKRKAFEMVFKAVEMKRAAYFEQFKKNPGDDDLKKMSASVALNLAKEVNIKKFLFKGGGGDFLFADTKKKIAELTEDEVSSETLEMPISLRKSLFHLARSEPRLVGAGVSMEDFEAQNRERVNLAFIASINGASDADILKILKGE